jgi:hypothetical protein
VKLLERGNFSEFVYHLVSANKTRLGALLNNADVPRPASTPVELASPSGTEDADRPEEKEESDIMPNAGPLAVSRDAAPTADRTPSRR